ncbi:MAG TPA: hypothetical protein QF621_02240 [Candidatus Thalassarchaeaceae archaeon]|nr:hypothetical protein [Candidatus Thalassarchaeaceae archaeon]
MRRYWILVVLCLFTSMMSTVSADRSDAIEGEAIIESSGYESIDLLTETGTPVEVWVDVIGNDSASHPIDIYITTWDSYLLQHYCLDDWTVTEDNAFQPLYSKESLSESDLPFHFSWTPEVEDNYVLFFDNCDNNRDSDYWLDQSQIIVKYAVDDQTDELAEGILAFLGGSLLLCCGGPVCLLIVIIVIIVMVTRKKPQQNVMAYQAPGAMPMQSGMAAAQPGFPSPAPTLAPAPMPAPLPAPAPAPAPVQNPEAMNYYNGLIGQGHSAEAAASYTSQHFPGFQP